MSTAMRPNILWITTHDISPDLGCYAGIWPGAEYAITPNLDRLAAEGRRYDHACATTPVCAPSRSAIITGMFPTAIGTMHMRSKAVPPPEVRCFPEYLRAAGYYCSCNAFTDHQFQTPVTVYDDFGPQAHWRNRPDPTQPFFATFHGMLTHESQLHVSDEQFQQRSAMLEAHERHNPNNAPLPPYYPDTPIFRQVWARYADLITATDHWVGDLLCQLEEDGLVEDTLVIFWSDHGLGLPRAKRYPYESGLREPLIMRWPGKIASGTVCTDLVYLMDLAATMLMVAELPIPKHMHAQPLFNAQGHQCAPARQYLFGHRDRMDEQEDTIRTVRDQRFRYLRNYHPDRPYLQHHEYADQMSTWREMRRLRFEEANQLAIGEQPNQLSPIQRHFLASTKPPEELYDLQADPYETVNLADDMRYAADMQRLRVALEQWQQRYGDLGMLPEEQLLQRWRPDGVQQVTAAPQLKYVDGILVASCATEGASIAWTADPPQPGKAPNMFSLIAGDPDTGGRSWQLYSGLFAPPAATQLWFRAQRLGFRASEDVDIMCP